MGLRGLAKEEPPVTRTSRSQVLRALRARSHGRSDNLGGHNHGLWCDEEGFYYDQDAHRPTATRRQLQDPLDGRPGSAVRRRPRSTTSMVEKSSVFLQRLRTWFIERPAQAQRTISVQARREPPPPPPAPRSRTASACSACCTLHARRDRVPVAVRLYRSLSRVHLKQPYNIEIEGQTLQRALQRGRVRHRHVRWQLELAWRCGSRSTTCWSRRSSAITTSARRVPDRVSDRLGREDELERRGGRTRAPAVQAVPRRRARAAADARDHRPRYANDPDFKENRVCSTSTSTVTPGAALARRTRPGGPAWRQSMLERAALFRTWKERREAHARHAAATNGGPPTAHGHGHAHAPTTPRPSDTP